MKALVWFRSDLRCEDNAALWHAAKQAQDGVIGVFLVAREQWAHQDWGAVKTNFVLRNVLALSQRLEELGIALIVADAPLYDDAPEALLEIARRHGASTLFYEIEEEIWEMRRDRAVAERLRGVGIDVVSFQGRSIFAPAEVQKGDGGFYSVFTPYHRAWLKRFLAAPPEILPTPKRRTRMVGTPTPYAVPPEEEACEDLWPAGEKAARKRLETFLRSAGQAYHELRDFPNRPGTSLLSPYLAAGVLSPRVAFAATLSANRGEPTGGDAGLDAWLRQLVWRDFYRHVLVGFPRVCKGRAFKPETEALRWSDDEAAFDAWREGRTGVPIVDAGMRQLSRTGWMHNRLRMVTAMFLTKDLLIDWRRGERHFMQRLVDADLAQNNGGWQWAASTGTDAAPYFRIFNPWTQGKRFDPDGEYIRRFVPELAGVDAKYLHDERAVAMRVRHGYPEPIVKHATAREITLAAWERLRQASRAKLDRGDRLLTEIP